MKNKEKTTGNENLKLSEVQGWSMVCKWRRDGTFCKRNIQTKKLKIRWTKFFWVKDSRMEWRTANQCHELTVNLILI